MILAPDEQDVTLAVTSWPQPLRICKGAEIFGLLDDYSLNFLFLIWEAYLALAKDSRRFPVISRHIHAVDGVHVCI